MTMRKIITQSAFALSLLAGAAIIPGAALANSRHDHDHFGGPPRHHDHYAWRGYRGYYGPRPYAYGPRYYEYGYRPGAGVSIGIY